MGWNYDSTNLEDAPPALTCWDLDEGFRKRPVVIYQKTKHAVVVNSAALIAAGITSSTPDPNGGIIERNTAGEPIGVFREMAAMEMIETAMPDPSFDGVVRSLHAAMDYLDGVGRRLSEHFSPEEVHELVSAIAHSLDNPVEVCVPPPASDAVLINFLLYI